MKPILFNTLMTQALLEDRKHETRRLVKPAPPDPCEVRKMPDGAHAGEWALYCDNPMLNASINSPWGHLYEPPCHVGDILYVRETWTKLYYVDPSGYTHYDQPMFFYSADGTPDIILRDEDGIELDDQRIRWRPSIHMPREAARIFLQVRDVRAERLQKITASNQLTSSTGRLSPLKWE